MAFWDLTSDWVEGLVLFVLLSGFVLSVFTDSFAVKLVLIFVVGLMFGRTWFVFQKRGKFVLTSVIAGFLFGFVVGNLLANIREITVIFFVGFLLSYFAHKKKWIKTTY